MIALVELLDLVWNFHILNPLTYILRVYELCFGIIIIVIDSPADRFPQCIRERALNLAPFDTETNTNRILFYLFIACLQGSLGTWFNIFCGWYFAAVVFLFTAVTLSTPAERPLRGNVQEDRAVPLAS